jgi:hypothetical protein
MKLVIQSITTAEVLYPYYASLFAGYLKEKKEEFIFHDQNLFDFEANKKFSATYIFISWISINSLKRNIESLISTIEKNTSGKVHIISDDKNIEQKLLTSETLRDYVYPNINFVNDHELNRVRSDYTIANFDHYTPSIFSGSGRQCPIPISVGGKYRGVNIKRDIEILVNNYNIQDFCIESSGWMTSSDCREEVIKYFFTTKGVSSWYVLKGLPAKFATKHLLKEFENSKCKAVAITYAEKDTLSSDMILTKMNKLPIIGYYEVSSKSFFNSLRMCFFSLKNNTSLNHYYIDDNRSCILKVLALFFYILGLMKPLRFKEMFYIVTSSRVLFKRLCLKLKRF